MYNELVLFLKNNLSFLTQFAIHLILLAVAIEVINRVSDEVQDNLVKDSGYNNKLHILFVVSRTIKVLLVVVVLASFLQANGYSLTSLMAGLGITGLALGFAAKESLASIFGSFSIMLDNVYKIGDYVEINGYAGIVEYINFRSTKLRTVNNALITIPNNIAADSIVQNRSNAKYFRLIENFDIEYDTSDDKIELALRLISDICSNCDKFGEDFSVFVSELGENSIRLQLIANTTTNQWADLLKLKSELLRAVIRDFRSNGINFAFPSRTVYLRNEN